MVIGEWSEFMWRPPQRIAFEPARGRMPSRDEARASLLFSRVGVGPLELEQRTWIPAMVPWRATEDGFVTDDVIDWYSRFARGRPGAIVIEATGIRDVPSGPLLRIGHDRFIPGLQRLTAAIREASGGHTKALIQIIDFLSIRRRPERGKFIRQFLRVDAQHKQALGDAQMSDEVARDRLEALPDAELDRLLSARDRESLRFGHRERVTDTQFEHIRNLPQALPGLFADAAARAKAAGFDGVELHYAHAYTMASFLSRRNTREDGYGQTLEGRARLPLETIAAVRAAVGRDYALGCRFLAEECIDGGSTVDDAAYFGAAFARAGLDFLSTSRGGKFEDAKQPGVGAAAYPYTGPSGYECMPQYISDERGPFGRNIDATKRIRAAVRAAGFSTPVVCTGGVHNFEMAEAMLREGACDIVGSARQSLADPDWFLKLSEGAGDEIRLCEFTNYCEGLDQKHKSVTCQLWDKIGVGAPGVRTTPDGRRRMTPPEWRPSRTDAT
ncbi:MAG: hypothetical protein KGM42_04115 [Hyphomicrobiales bacterium]|nr:hypothetical protein [Hyphomicrobiales bacterium]